MGCGGWGPLEGKGGERDMGGVALIKFLGGFGCVWTSAFGHSGTHFHIDFYGFLDPFGPPFWTSLA